MLSGVNTPFLKPVETENSILLKIFTQLDERRTYELSYINNSLSFQYGITAVAYYEEMEDRPDITTIALRRTEIQNPLISIRNQVGENERSLVLNDIANIEIASENWESFNWMFVLGLHVHHNYYIAGKHPWEYPDEALVTLCWHCHEEKHKGGKIMECDEDGLVIRELTYCYRCHGAGVFPEYAHVQHGICFRCHGAQFEELIQ